MATWLHDRTALESVADGPPGPARDWANVRLALLEPARMRQLPSGVWDTTLALAAGARCDEVLGRLRAGVEGAIPAVDDLLALGRMPDDPEPWVAALRAAPAGPLQARALADLDALDGDVLAAAARADTGDGRIVIPGLVMRFAASRGAALGPVAAEIAAKLDLAELGWALTVLGLPHVDAGGLDPESAVALGSRLAGVTGPRTTPRGSARSRARRWIRDLLAGRAGPAAALLLALTDRDGPDLAELCALAAWCAAIGEPGVEAVLGGAAGEDRRLLAIAARTELDAAAVRASLEDEGLRSTPVVGLAARIPTPEVQGALLTRAVVSAGVDASAVVGGILAAVADPDAVPAWIGQPELRRLGLMFARYTPTLEVLTALLALPVPADPEERDAWGWALADQADPAAVSALSAARSTPPEVLAHARGLLLGA